MAGPIPIYIWTGIMKQRTIKEEKEEEDAVVVEEEEEMNFRGQAIERNSSKL